MSSITRPFVDALAAAAAAASQLHASTPPATQPAGRLSDGRAWTPADVVALMDRLYPRTDDDMTDAPRRQQRLCSAFLAGATEAQGARLQHPGAAFVTQAMQLARTLLKNRAAREDSRLWHAFMAGAHAAEVEVARLAALAGSTSAWANGTRALRDAAREAAPLKLFVRQPFTESDEAQQRLIAGVLERIDAHNGKPLVFDYLTGKKAESADTFRASFEAESGQRFTPPAFRAHRLARLSQAEAFVNIRVGMSESSAFELSYHIFRGACTPVLFLVWKHAPIKTTLLKELGNLCDVTYLEFEHADELDAGMAEFFGRCAREGARSGWPPLHAAPIGAGRRITAQ